MNNKLFCRLKGRFVKVEISSVDVFEKLIVEHPLAVYACLHIKIMLLDDIKKYANECSFEWSELIEELTDFIVAIGRFLGCVVKLLFYPVTRAIQLRRIRNQLIAKSKT